MGTLITTLLLALLQRTWVYVLCIVVGIVGAWKIHHWWNATSDKPETTSAQVLEIVSGDTIATRAGLVGLQRHNWRLWGLEVPQAITTEAQAHLETLISVGDTIAIEVRQPGSGIITSPNGRNLNLSLLEHGLATATVTEKSFTQAEAQAKKQKAGVWHDYKPGWFGTEQEEEK